ncbi:MAG: hypothetical protein R3A50_08095 [Saprospiraceae bacterium]
MKSKLHLLTLLLTFFSQLAYAQYDETFSTPNKGYLINNVDDFIGIDWTLSSWGAGRDAGDYFQTTVGGVLESIDLDQEVCWTSPLLTVSATGNINFTADITWAGFDVNQSSPLEFINVEYSINGGAWVRHPNVVGSNGDSAYTVRYTGGVGPFDGMATTNFASIAVVAGNSFQVRVCASDNANAEVVTIDNVHVSGVTQGCAAPQLSTVVTPVGCSNPNSGAIDLTPSAGNPPYSYAWSNSATTQDISGIPTGTYTVTVTDAAMCTASISATVGNAPALVLSTQVLNATCGQVEDGEISLAVSGGVPGYTYDWSNDGPENPDNDDEDLIGVPQGTYTVTVTDASGCTATTSGTIGLLPTSAYLETFSIDDKGYFLNWDEDFAGVNWTLSSWPLEPPDPFGRDVNDYFQTVGGQLKAIDLDQEVCWISPVIEMGSATQFSVDLTWEGFDDLDYINVNYSIDGGAYQTVPNQVGGGAGTIQYLAGSNDGATTVTVMGLSGNTIQIKVCGDFNANAEIMTIDNVSVPNSMGIHCPGPQPSIVVTDVACNGYNNGSLDLSVTDGTPPYSYLWSNSATTEDISGLSPGTYTVTVTDANSLIGTASAVVSEPAVLMLSTTQMNVSCNGGTNGSIDLTVTGGTSGYTFAWTNGDLTEDISNLGPGTYTVTVTDANMCTGTISATITQPSALMLSFTWSNVLCNGGSDGSINLTVSGGTPTYSYAWSNGATTEDISGLSAGTYTVTVTDANMCTKSASQMITEQSALQLNTTQVNVSCNGGADGSIDLTVTGGKSPYTYSWSNGATSEDISGLSVGTYGVTVTDANMCTKASSVTLTEPTPINLSTEQSNVTCFGASNGEIGLIAFGGTPGYSFNWSNGATSQDLSGIPAGTYTVTVTDANSCTATTSTTITQPDEIMLTTSQVNVSCFGGNNGSATVMVSGGVGPFVYNWSTGGTMATENFLAAGTYTVTVYDDPLNNPIQCTKTATVTITQPTDISLSTTVMPACAGVNNGSIDLMADGGTPGYTYLWSTGATSEDVSGLGVGTYTVTVTDANQCTKSVSATVTQSPVMNLSTTSTNTCTGTSQGTIDLTVTGGTPGYTYFWTTGAAIQDITGLAAGTYTVTVTDAQGCTTTTSQVVVANPVPTVNAVSNQALCANTATTAVNFTGTPAGVVFRWTNNTTSVGLAASGVGNIPSFTALNASNAPVIATITVTPEITAGGTTCFGTSRTFTITVNPVPAVFAVTGGGLVCTTDVTGVAIGLNGSQTNVNYQLFQGGIATGGPVAGTGAAISFGPHLAGTYTVVATHTQGACTANMSGSATVSNFNCTIEISDPCVCLNNATTLTNGQFGETIKVNAPSTQVWVVESVTGLFSASSPAPPTAPIPISVGTMLVNIGGNMFTQDGRHVDAIGYMITVGNGLGTSLNIGNSCAYPNPSITSDLAGDFCLFSDPVNLTGTPGDANIISEQFTVNGVPTNVFDPSQGVGQYIIKYTVDGGDPKAFGPNDPGCVQSVMTTVNVVQTPAVLNCNDQIYVSLPASCTGEVMPDDVLEGTYGCFDDYIVELDKTQPFGNGPWLPATLGVADIGKTYQTRVTHLVSGNKCWGLVTIEDKLAPKLTCEDIHLICPVVQYTPAYITGVLGIPAGNPTITDCSNFTSSYTDTWVDLACGATINGMQDISAYVKRKWTAVDEWGNSTTCQQYIYFDRKHVGDVKFPADYEISCASSINLDPSVTGAPYLEGFGLQWPLNPDAGFCEMQSAYTDQILPVCDGTYKILRTWTVLDWCLPTTPTPPFTNPMYYIQLIKVVDDQGPAFSCPANLTVSIDPFSCCGTVNLPDAIIEDGCSRVNNIEAMITTFDPYTGEQTGMYTVGGTLTDFPGNNWWDRDTMGNWGTTPCLPIGTHTVVYSAQDDCSNVSTCSFRLAIRDLIPPVAACDQFTQVSLGPSGSTLVNATTFDDGSYDLCCFDYVKAGRMGGGLDDQVEFTCDDIGDTLTIMMRAWDCAGNTNECMVRVVVDDKIKPICQSPQNFTVTCEQFDPSLWLYGKADILDNCCLDTNKVYLGQQGLTHSVNYSQFDTLCNKGTIVRTFRAFDCNNNSSQCTQRIVVNYEQDYYVRFPNDVIVTVCDGTGNYGEPTFFGEDCELLGVSYEDEVFTVVPDACFKIERHWRIINWCTYDPNGICIDVPNPSPNAIANHASNLPGPIVSPIQTSGDPWKSTIVKIKSTDATSTNYSVYYDPNANCYTYKQIIKVIDTQDPVVDCPGSPQTICDVTANDAQLWNESYWWDNANQSHDLCEAPSDICITATDLCSGSNINIEYQLFLDLDGDGVMETVVNSTQLGNQAGGLGWNNIMYGNVTGAGQSRQFDGRPVPTNQKWGFAIQETVTGNDKTACVKFNTFQAQNTYVTPQLPHGTHKIKWFVSDGCGNETVCEYTIVIKDCKAPTVVCLNGLSVNIMPTGMIQLWATDFLQYAEDNCTLTPYLKYGIRKCGQGTGFPVDAQGNPITNVTFDCTELGSQCVELWAIDLAGNADYCETYVIVQDNNGNCPNGSKINVSGYLKTEADDGVTEADVLINTSVVSTDDNGYYQLANVIPMNADVTIIPAKDDNPLNGVTTYDLVLMSKHILGIEPLNSPYKMIAADANKSNSITTFDVVELRKLILGIYQELPNNTSWRFVDKAQVFSNPLNPFMDPIQESIFVPNATMNLMNQDFVSIKIGDVNNTVVANSLMTSDDRTSGTLLFDVEDREINAGDVFEVTFTASEKSQGYQMTLNLNGLQVTGLVENDKVNTNNFGVFADALTVSIDGADHFTVKFRAEKSGKLSELLGVSSRITKAEAYSLVNDRQEVALRFDGKTIAGVGFELYQNQPNPFVNKTAIGFHLPEAGAVTLSIFDEMGRLVFTQKGEFAKGYNFISLDKALLNAGGVLYYTVETATETASRKMIQTK